MMLAPTVPVRTRVELFPLDRANEALAALRAGRITGAAVLEIHAWPSYGAATASSSADDAARASASTPSRRASQRNGSASA